MKIKYTYTLSEAIAELHKNLLSKNSSVNHRDIEVEIIHEAATAGSGEVEVYNNKRLGEGGSASLYTVLNEMGYSFEQIRRFCLVMWWELHEGKIPAIKALRAAAQGVTPQFAEHRGTGMSLAEAKYAVEEYMKINNIR